MSGLWQEKRWKTTALMLALWVNVECFKQVMLRCFCSPFVRNYEEWKKVAKHWSLVQTFCRDFRMFLLTLVFFFVERVDIPAHASAAHKGVLQKGGEGDLCRIIPHVPRWPSRSRDWNERFLQYVEKLVIFATLIISHGAPGRCYNDSAQERAYTGEDPPLVVAAGGPR